MQALANLLSPMAFWGLAAAIPAVTAEYLYKVWPEQWPWWYGLPAWVPMQLAIGYCIFRLVSAPGNTLLDAFVIWAFSTTFIRVVLSVVVLGETVKGGTWFALGLLIMANIAKTFWGR